jgi:excisionase family DNA binding protein
MGSGQLNIEEISKGRYRLELSLDLRLAPGLFSGQPDIRPAYLMPQPVSEGHDAQDKPQKLALTVEDVAEQLDIGRCSVYDLLRRGELESIKIGRLRRIPLTCLQAYVERRLTEGG